MKIIRADTYTIFIGEDAFEELALFFRNPDIRNEKIIVLVDENSKKYCLPLLKEKVELFNKATILEVKSGEENKNIQTCVELWHYLLKVKATRKSILVNLGGGVITDMGGFVASTFKRGMRFINIPTTLLAQVDSSIGGKVGVNLFEIKNQIGVFLNPEAVFIVPPFINTLPESERLSGLAEMLKHALIMDNNYWDSIKRKPFFEITEWESLIIRSIEIKNSVARNDPYEKSLRKRLNFGHTIGHAFESLALRKAGKPPLPHGVAVAMGIICEAYLSTKIRGLPEGARDSINDYILANFPYYPVAKKDHPRVIEIIKHDKKHTGEGINFTLIPSIGNALIDQYCDERLVLDSLVFYSSLS
ncbi:MAG: 3-dehydroquinate synthase [Bacteroidales bacterium]|nr:3-dehydroquinate synthase [Bacteroidales bacterium]